MPPHGDLFELAHHVQLQQEEILNLKNQVGALVAVLTSTIPGSSTNYTKHLKTRRKRSLKSSEFAAVSKLQGIAVRLADKR